MNFRLKTTLSVGSFAGESLENLGKKGIMKSLDCKAFFLWVGSIRVRKFSGMSRSNS